MHIQELNEPWRHHWVQIKNKGVIITLNADKNIKDPDLLL